MYHTDAVNLIPLNHSFCIPLRTFWLFSVTPSKTSFVSVFPVSETGVKRFRQTSFWRKLFLQSCWPFKLSSTAIRVPSWLSRDAILILRCGHFHLCKQEKREITQGDTKPLQFSVNETKYLSRFLDYLAKRDRKFRRYNYPTYNIKVKRKVAETHLALGQELPYSLMMHCATLSCSPSRPISYHNWQRCCKLLNQSCFTKLL